jgi:hypothetical protein
LSKELVSSAVYCIAYGLQTMLVLFTAALRQSAYCCARFACSSALAGGTDGAIAAFTSAVMFVSASNLPALRRRYYKARIISVSE